MATKTKTPSARREGGHVLEMQRRRLLLAYTEVLAEHGWQATSVDRICKRAGVSRRTFYDLFLDREGCFLAAFELAIERITAHVVPLHASEGRWRERVRGALTTLLELFDDEPALARLCVVETLKAGPAVLERRRAALDALVGALEESHGPKNTTVEEKAPSLTAEGIVGGVVSVIHTRLVERDTTRPLVALVNPLMSMIVHPYLGPEAAARELEHASPQATHVRTDHGAGPVQEPFKDLPIRITFRTARVLAAMGAQPGASNREIGDAAGVSDQGQISKLLRRLERSGLARNTGEGHPKGEPNAWTLTRRGQAIQRTIDPPARPL